MITSSVFEQENIKQAQFKQQTNKQQFS